MTKEKRYQALKDFGCIACYLDGNTKDSAIEIHHLLSGSRRIGDEATIPLCFWHHQGIGYDGIPTAWLLENVGPSYHKHRREFRKRYGNEAEILQTTNEVIFNGTDAS